MLQDERTLVVVADGGQARFFEERRLGGPLRERVDWSEGLKPHHAGSGSPGRVFDRFGSGSHPVGGVAPHDQAEARFMSAVAGRIAELATKDVFDGVVLIAPPRALGQLREALSPAVAARVRHSEPKDRVHADLKGIETAVGMIRRHDA